MFSSIAIIGYALDIANILNFQRLSVIIALVIIFLLMYDYKSKLNFNKKEIIQCTFVIIAFFFIGIMPVLFSFYPINHSVDFVHHYSLLNYIYEHQTLVKQAEGNLGEMYRYPFGIDLIQAYLSWLTGIDTLRMGHIFLTLIFSLTSLSFFGLLEKIFIKKVNGNIVAFCSPFLLLVLKDYSLLEYWGHYHSSQMFGTLIILTSMLILSEIENNKLLEMSLILGSITLMLTFPLWIAILNFFVMLFYILRKIPKKKKILCVVYFIVPQIAIFIVYYLQGYVSSSIGISSNNGGTTLPSIASFGGYIYVILFIIGIAVFLKTLIKKEIAITSVEMIFGLAFTGIVIQFISLKVLIKVGFGSEYMVTKIFFLVKYFYVAIIAFAILEMSKHIRISRFNKRFQYFMTSCLFLIGLCISLLFLLPKTNSLINQGEYKLASQVKNDNIRNNMMLYPYPESPVTSYLIYTGIWKEDRFLNSMSYNYLFNNNIPNIMEWINGSGNEEYALIGNVKMQLVKSNLLKYVKIINSYGNSVIVKRTSNKLNFNKIDGILNYSFESSDVNWTKVKYNGSDFEETIESNKYYDGSKSISIKGKSINGGVSQKVKLESNTLYKITAWCSGENIRKVKGLGAFMGIQGSNENIVNWPQSDFDWQKKELIFNSKNLSEINLVLGLGAYGSASGQAWFDKIEIYKEDITD